MAASLIAASVLFGLLAGEVAIRAFHRFDAHALSLKESWDQYKNLAYVDEDQVCAYEEVLMSHPYLGWVMSPYDPSCHREKSNNLGFWDRRDFPVSKNEDYFTILVTGGSFAAQFAYGSLNDNRPAVHWLEDLLNQRFVSPNGKPFRVLSGAMGGWQEPTQVIVTALYGDRVDAVLALDGVAEAFSAMNSQPIGRPDDWMMYAVSTRDWISWRFLAIKTLPKFRNFASNNGLLRNSWIAFLLFKKAVLLTYGSEDDYPVGAAEANRYFTFPGNWDEEKKVKANISLWKKYLSLLRAETQAMGLKYAHFIEPILAINKPMTDAEKGLLRGGERKAQFYRKVVIDPSMEMKAEGFPVFSLIDVFKNEKRTIYGDASFHCAYSPDGDNPGYKIIADAIAKNLADAWQLRLRK